MYLNCILICGILSCLVGCDLNLGPPRPEHYCKKYLTEHGWTTNVVDTILNGREVDHDTVVRLINVPDVSVRHILGRNRFLTQEDRKLLFNDSNEFVRSGVAMNPNLTQSEIVNAMSDPAKHLVPIGLAMNPNVPSDILLRLRHEHKVPLVFFAQNANCPPEIVKEIERSGSSLEKDLLTNGRRRGTEGSGTTEKTAIH